MDYLYHAPNTVHLTFYINPSSCSVPQQLLLYLFLLQIFAPRFQGAVHMPCDLLCQAVFTSHNALLVDPFPACLCSWLVFIIELSHCVDTIQFSVASWLVIVWGCDATWYLRSQFSISHPSCPFCFQLTSARCLAAWDSVPTSTLKWSASRGVGLSFCPDLSLDQHVTKGFFLFTATVEKGFVWTHAVMMPPCLTSLLCLFWFLRRKWFLPFPANLWAELCFIHFTLGCAVFSLYMMGDIWGPASSEQPTRSSMLFWNHPPTSFPSFLSTLD